MTLRNPRELPETAQIEKVQFVKIDLKKLYSTPKKVDPFP
jgi:hypothetical protein